MIYITSIHLGNHHDMTPEERFWFYTDKKDSNSCWNWKAKKDKDGYGRMKINGKDVRTHRFSYNLHYGNIPPDKPLITHICNNPSCVNPNHLKADTNDGNLKYMASLKRSTIGETNPNAKLTQTQVNEIKKKYVKRKITHKMLSEEYKVHPMTICRLLIGKNWK